MQTIAIDHRSNSVRRRTQVLLLGIALIAAAGLRTADADPRPVRIGGTLSLTGKHAKIAAYQEKGTRLWARDANARGGILGRPVELVLLDDRSDPKTAAELYRRLIVEERVDLLVAPFSSDITEAVLPVTDRQGYPLIVSGASADRIWQKGYRNAFGLFLPASRFTVGFFEMLVRSGVDRIALFHDDHGFAEDVAAGARTWASRFGLTVVHDERYPRGMTDFTPLARKARDAGAGVVVLASYLEEAIAMRQAFAAVGWTPRAYYVPVGPGAAEFRTALGDAADGVYSTSQWEALARGPQGGRDEFIQAYVRAYGSEPTYFSATAYAAGQIMAAAVGQTGSLDRAALRKALSTMDTTSIIGRYGVDQTGLQIKNINLVIQLQKGRKEVVWPAEYRTAAPRFP